MLGKAEEAAELDKFVVARDRPKKNDEVKPKGPLYCICRSFVPPGERLLCRGANEHTFYYSKSLC